MAQMEITSLKYLLSVAEAGSFSEASRSLNLHVSTLSRQVFALENELGVTIFEREHSGVRLTSSGQTVLIYAQRALAGLNALAKIGQSGGTGKHGSVRLGVRMPPIGDPIKGLLANWHHFHPDVELTMYELTDHELRTAINNRHLDTAIIVEHALWPDAASAPIYSEKLLAALPTNHPILKMSSVRWDTLSNETILVQDWPRSHVTRSFYSSLLGPSPRFCSHSVSKQSLLSLVAAGFGVTLATESQACAGFPGVTFVTIDEVNASVNVVLAWAPQNEDPAVGRFVAFMRDEAQSLHLRTNKP